MEYILSAFSASLSASNSLSSSASCEKASLLYFEKKTLVALLNLKPFGLLYLWLDFLVAVKVKKNILLAGTDKRDCKIHTGFLSFTKLSGPFLFVEIFKLAEKYFVK